MGFSGSRSDIRASASSGAILREEDISMELDPTGNRKHVRFSSCVILKVDVWKNQALQLKGRLEGTLA